MDIFWPVKDSKISMPLYGQMGFRRLACVRLINPPGMNLEVQLSEPVLA